MVLVLVVVVLAVIFSSSQEPPKKILGIQNKETAAITCFEKECFLTNSDGIAFSYTARPSGTLFFLIDLKDESKAPKIGEEAISQATLVELLFLRKKAKEELNTYLNHAAPSSNLEDFDFETNEGWVLRVSVENNANATLEILRRVLDELGSQRFNLAYIDLRLPTRVYYKFK